jgi:hypothetical protein
MLEKTFDHNFLYSDFINSLISHRWKETLWISRGIEICPIYTVHFSPTFALNYVKMDNLVRVYLQNSKINICN